MDSILGGLVAILGAGRSSKPPLHLRNEDGYYAAFSGEWPVLTWSRRLAARRRASESRIAAPAGFRMIAATAAVVLSYCALVPFAPALLSGLA
jgi:hypothetical protein